MNQLFRLRSQFCTNQLCRTYFRLGGHYNEEFKKTTQDGEVLGWHRCEEGVHEFPRDKIAGHRRVGLMGVKLGVTNMWHKFSGEPIICTVVQVLENHVVQKRCLAHHDEVAMLVGTGDLPWPGPPKERGMLTEQDWRRQQKDEAKRILCRRAGVPFKRFVGKFSVSLDALLPLGTALDTSHLRAGQFVDALGTTKAKGFQGVMKRWGFHGMPASHGQTKTHRKMGNVASSGIGRVWKGTKMPGHMGDDLLMKWAMQVVRINHRLGLVYLHGAVPGTKGESWVQLRDSLFRPRGVELPVLPFPTSERGDLPCEEICDVVHSPGQSSLQFSLDTSRMGEHLKLSIETRKREVWDFDIPEKKE